MLRNIRAFNVASLRVAVRPRFPSRTAVPLIATGTFAAVAANHFLDSGCTQCLEDTGGDSSPVTGQISQVECAVKQNDLESMWKVTSRLKVLAKTAPKLFPEDEKLREQMLATYIDSKKVLDTLGNVYLDAVIAQARRELPLEHAELKSKVEGWKHQYPEYFAESDVKDGMEGDLLDLLERNYRDKQDKAFHGKVSKGSGKKGGPTGVH